MAKLTKATARNVLALVDQGLTKGLGNPEPGKMCIEAAVCYALGEPHSDSPSCVSTSLRAFKIRLNDVNWSSNEARAKGMRRLAIIQLGTAGVLDEIEFVKLLAKWAQEVIVPRAASAAARHAARHAAASYDASDAARHAAASYDASAAARYAARHAADAARHAADVVAYAASAAHYDASAAARYAARHAAYAAAYAADVVAYAASAASARDKSLTQSAEEVVQILVSMKVPAAKWLDLAPYQC